MNAFFIFSCSLSLSSAFPYPSNYPYFHDEGKSQEKPTINVYKIYAPKLLYMPGFSNLKKDKQLFFDRSDFLNEIGDTPSYLSSIFGDNANDVLDDDFVPEPSNIVSRKLPVYGPPLQTIEEYEPSMHLDNFNNPERRYWGEGRDIRNSYDPLDDMYSDMTFNEIVPFTSTTVLDSVNMLDRPAKISSPLITNPKSFKGTTSFEKLLKKILSKPFGRSKAISPSQYITTISFGEPEIIDEATGVISDQMKKMNDEIGEPKTEVSGSVDPKRPDGSSVEEKNDQSVEEVEVNIVKTVLPDDSFLIGKAGTQDEVIQNEVISMIQNSDGNDIKQSFNS